MDAAKGYTPAYVEDDCAALEYILLGDLRDLLEEPSNVETCRWLIAVLDALLGTDSGDAEPDTDDADGYLTVVLEHYPSWYPQVDRLQREHRALYARLREFRERVAHEQSFNRIAGVLRRDLRDWMTSFTAHHRHENRLLQTAVNLEVGCGD